MAAGRYVVGTTLLVDMGRALACEGKGAYNRPDTSLANRDRVKKTAKASAHGHDHKHCIEDALAAAEKLCAERTCASRPLRRRVLELVWSSHKPVGAYALLDELRNEELGSAPPTVYRALDFLIDNGLIHRIERMNASSAAAIPARRTAASS
jgi:Fur family zinc uptake transcriptional regulator